MAFIWELGVVPFEPDNKIFYQRNIFILCYFWPCFVQIWFWHKKTQPVFFAFWGFGAFAGDYVINIRTLNIFKHKELI